MKKLFVTYHTINCILLYILSGVNILISVTKSILFVVMISFVEPNTFVLVIVTCGIRSIIYLTPRYLVF